MSAGEHFVYQYLDRSSGATVYVGYGMATDRALSHAKTSHNDGLRAWLEKGEFELRIAGPYASKQEGFAVEAALISAISPKFNKHPGNGPKFRPLGVPEELADRPSMTPLTVDEIGAQAGGALIVYIAPGTTMMPDGRPKYDPAHPDPATVAIDVEAWWQVDRHLKDWAAHPDAGPQVLVGAYGRPGHRFVIGAYAIDTSRWGKDRDTNTDSRGRWRIPLVDKTQQDAANLCGRRIESLKFGQFPSSHYKWVADDGTVRWPLPKDTTPATASEAS